MCANKKSKENKYIWNSAFKLQLFGEIPLSEFTFSVLERITHSFQNYQKSFLRDKKMYLILYLISLRAAKMTPAA